MVPQTHQAVQRDTICCYKATIKLLVPLNSPPLLRCPLLRPTLQSGVVEPSLLTR